MSDGQVLVIESDAQQASTWRHLLEFSNYEPVVIPEPGVTLPSTAQPDSWVAALIGQTEHRRGLDKLLTRLRDVDGSLPLVAVGDRCLRQLDPSIRAECLQLPLPVKYPRLVATLEKARRRHHLASLRDDFPCGSSVAMVELKDLMARVASHDSTVLILGESGVGKELVARRIHALSPRHAGPFVPVNCGAIPKDLLESELFGHKKGAFSGAVADSPGLVRSAHEGTLFLDEIADLPAPSQAA